ncbi:dipeptidase [Kineococcus rubinsiae]|uniref:dipeptidase n=1 Tax=Kineococcus rubinsiae TaxID=2609562 RepID=UPI0027E49D05|nr:dipeptidase [Kineococcus rubinsiae]
MTTTPAEPPSELVSEVLSAVPLVDGHNDLPFALRATRGCAVDGFRTGLPDLHTDAARLRAGRVGAQFWSVWVPSSLAEPQAVVDTLEQVDVVHRLVAAHPDVLALTCTADEVEAAFAAGRTASLLGVEGGHSLAGSLGVLRCLARLGVRYLTLTHNDSTAWADSATGEVVVGGLDDAGRAVVAELNRTGVLVDLSHTADSTQRAALAASSAPVIFSHSSAKAVTDHPRNVADEVLELVARHDGVVQVTFLPAFVSQAVADHGRELAAERARLGLPRDGWAWPRGPRPGESDEQAAAAVPAPAPEPELQRWLEAHPAPVATIADVADHVEHVREVAGAAHVGLGGDYDGTDALPAGLEDVSGYPRLLGELARRGFSRADLEALTGRNVLRVLRAAEDVATEPLWPGARSR